MIAKDRVDDQAACGRMDSRPITFSGNFEGHCPSGWELSFIGIKGFLDTGAT